MPIMYRRLALLIAAALLTLGLGTPVQAGYSFASIDGGTIELDDLRGRPVLVVNTASLCGFAGQFDDLQILQDRYGPQGLYVLAVPSNDFDQELASGAEVSLWLTGEAVALAVRGAQGFTLAHAADPLELLGSVLQAGPDEGLVTVCTQCAARRGLEQDDLLAGVRIAGAAVFVAEALRPGSQALVY